MVQNEHPVTELLMRSVYVHHLTYIHTVLLLFPGVQNSLELLRELLSEKAIYEPNRHVPVSFQDADILATTTNPGALGKSKIHGSYCGMLLW